MTWLPYDLEVIQLTWNRTEVVAVYGAQNRTWQDSAWMSVMPLSPIYVSPEGSKC